MSCFFAATKPNVEEVQRTSNITVRCTSKNEWDYKSFAALPLCQRRNCCSMKKAEILAYRGFLINRFSDWDGLNVARKGKWDTALFGQLLNRYGLWNKSLEPALKNRFVI